LDLGIAWFWTQFNKEVLMRLIQVKLIEDVFNEAQKPRVGFHPSARWLSDLI
jgi:hypothetical protein